MQLSKQEFSRLSKKEQNKLMNVQSKKASSAQQGGKKKSLKFRNNNAPRSANRGKQASVAAAYATPAVGRAPTIRATRDTCNIKHRELISSITGSVGFTVSSFLAVNPGIPATFPWLSIMAQGWEEYRFRSIRFVYKTRTGSTTPGSLIMAPDYDSADAAPATEQIMSTYSQCIEDAPWKDITCVLKTSNSNPLGKHHYIRQAALAANLDIKTYDIANFIVATTDGTAIPWGKLWVEYDVDFFIPQLPASGAVVIDGGKITGGAAFTNANPLGATAAVDAQAFGVAVDALSNVTLSDIGTYLVTFSVTGSTTLATMTLTAVSDCVVGVIAATVLNGATTAGIVVYLVTTTGKNAVFSAATTSAVVHTAANLWVGKAPSNSLN